MAQRRSFRNSQSMCASASYRTPLPAGRERNVGALRFASLFFGDRGVQRIWMAEAASEHLQDRLEVENLFLRHQLNVALRRAPRRLRLRGSDRILLVWMTRLWPSLLGLAQIVQPDTIPRTIGLTTPRRCEGHCTRRSAALRPKNTLLHPCNFLSRLLPSQ